MSSGVARLLDLGAIQLHGRGTAASLRRRLAPRDQGGGGCRRRRLPDRSEGGARTRDGAARRARPDQARRHGPDDRLDAGGASAAKVRPIILSGGLNADNVARRRRRGSARTPLTCRRASSRVRASRIPASCARSLPRSVSTKHEPYERDLPVLLSGPPSASAIRMPAATTDRTAGASSPRRSSRRWPSSRPPTSTARSRPAFRDELDGSAAPLRRTPDAALRGPASVSVARRRAPAAQARRPRAHRRAQDQQRARTGAARQADGQAAGDRRDRRRAARRRHGDGLRAARPDCDVYMGADDMERQALNVFRMELLGATVRKVDGGSRTLKDAINEAMRDWVATVADSYYLLGSVLGPHPYPLMVREFQSVIGQEARRQCQELLGRPARRHRRLRRRRQQRDGDLRRLHRRPRRAPDRRRGRRPRHHAGRARRAIRRRQFRRAAGHARPTCCRTRTATSS